METRDGVGLLLKIVTRKHAAPDLRYSTKDLIPFMPVILQFIFKTNSCLIRRIK